MDLTTKQYNEICENCKNISIKFGLQDEWEDLLHNVFLSSSNKDIDNVVHYITRSFKNRCIDFKRKKVVKYQSVDNLELVDEEESNYSTTAGAIIDAVDTELLLNVPALDKLLFISYFKEGLSYLKTSKKFKIANKTTIEKINNLVKYLCLIKIGKFYQKMKKSTEVKVRDEAYVKYVECVTSAHFGYSFNYDLFSEACEVILNVTLLKQDKYNKEKLKQAAAKLFNEIYVQVEPEPVIQEEEIKDDKPKRVSKNSRKTDTKQL